MTTVACVRWYPYQTRRDRDSCRSNANRAVAKILTWGKFYINFKSQVLHTSSIALSTVKCLHSINWKILLHLCTIDFLYFSGNRGSSKKKKNTTRLSADVANNPFLEPPVTLPSVESNPFLQFYDNKSESQSLTIISLPIKNQSSHVAVSSGNPFLNFGPDSRIDTVPFNASGPSVPVTQAPYRPPSHHTLESPRPQPPTSQRPFSEEVRPPITPSLLDLIPIKTRTRSELSKWNAIELVLRLQTWKLKREKENYMQSTDTMMI